MPDIHAIYRYPIKGLSPELLLRAELLPHETIPGDRLYAIENGLSSFNPAAPGYLSKTHFLMLMKNERLVFLFWPAGNAQTLIPRISLSHCRLSTTDPFLTHSHSAAATLTASRKAK
jgi:hypothetical protein